MMFVRNVGHLMTNPAILDENNEEVFEGIMDAGEKFALPATEEPATLRVGESGAVYFAINGVHYGPAGRAGTVTSNLALSSEALVQTYAQADLSADQGLADAVSLVAEVMTPTE